MTEVSLFGIKRGAPGYQKHFSQTSDGGRGREPEGWTIRSWAQCLVFQETQEQWLVFEQEQCLALLRIPSPLGSDNTVGVLGALSRAP